MLLHFSPNSRWRRLQPVRWILVASLCAGVALAEPSNSAATELESGCPDLLLEIVNRQKTISGLQTEQMNDLSAVATRETEIRVRQARAELETRLAALDSAIEEATRRLEEARQCQSRSYVENASNRLTCITTQLELAAIPLQKVIAALYTSYLSELAGLNSTLVRSVRVEHERLTTELNAVNDRLALARNAGDSAEILSLIALRATLETQRFAGPYLTGILSQAHASWKQWRTPTDQQAKEQGQAIRQAALAETFARIRHNVAESYAAAIKPTTVFKDSYYFSDFWQRFGIVAGINIGIQISRHMLSDGWHLDAGFIPGWADAPWYILPNTFIMMLIQAEYRARHHEENVKSPTPLLPAKNWSDLVARIPSMIAGRRGTYREAGEFATGWTSQMFLEIPVLTLLFGLYGGLIQNSVAPLVDVHHWTHSFFESIKFLSAITVYLIVKQAIMDRPIDLGFYPNWRAFTNGKHEEKLVELAKQQDIPTVWVDLLDPRTQETVQVERVDPRFIKDLVQPPNRLGIHTQRASEFLARFANMGLDTFIVLSLAPLGEAPPTQPDETSVGN